MSTRTRSKLLFTVSACVVALFPATTHAQEAEPPPAASSAPPRDASVDAGGAEADRQKLAKQLSNPVANLISVPAQANFDFGYGAEDDGFRMTINLQPVIPVTLDDDWNLITRTIVPIVYQNDVPAPGESKFGLGDTLLSLFASPASTEPFIWGLGPVFMLRTDTSPVLGTGKWGIGPTGVLLKQAGHITFGALANHVWSFAGDSGRADVSTTFLQPFFAYTLPSATTFTMNSETSYDWKGEQWLVPLNLMAAQLLAPGGQPMQVQVGGRYYLESPEGGPAWGLRFTYVLLLPK